MGTTACWRSAPPAGANPEPDGPRAPFFLKMAGALAVAGALVLVGCIGSIGGSGERNLVDWAAPGRQVSAAAASLPARAVVVALPRRGQEVSR